MKVAYKRIGDSGYIVLFDEEAALNVLPDFKPSFQDLNYIQPGFGAASQGPTPEGNTLVTLSLQFQITYGQLGTQHPRQLALASIRTMRALKGVRLHIQVTQDGEIQYYPNGVVDSYEADLMGATVYHHFTFKTQDVTITPP